jgi:hypothetical protein
LAGAPRDGRPAFQPCGRLDVLPNVLGGRMSHVPAHRSRLRLWAEDGRAIALSALVPLAFGGLAVPRAERFSGGQPRRVAIHALGGLGKQFSAAVENIAMEPAEGAIAAGAAWPAMVCRDALSGRLRAAIMGRGEEPRA